MIKSVGYLIHSIVRGISSYIRVEFPLSLASTSWIEKPSWLPDYIYTYACFVRAPILLILEELTTTLYFPPTCGEPGMYGPCPPETRGD